MIRGHKLNNLLFLFHPFARGHHDLKAISQSITFTYHSLPEEPGTDMQSRRKLPGATLLSYGMCPSVRPVTHLAANAALSPQMT